MLFFCHYFGKYMRPTSGEFSFSRILSAISIFLGSFVFGAEPNFVQYFFPGKTEFIEMGLHLFQLISPHKFAIHDFWLQNGAVLTHKFLGAELDCAGYVNPDQKPNCHPRDSFSPYFSFFSGRLQSLF